MTGISFSHPLPFGAAIQKDGSTRFRIWAPSMETLALEIDGAAVQPMLKAAGGWFALTTLADAGARYRFRLPDGLSVPDPASRMQSGDVHGWSVVVDPEAHQWRHGEWAGRPWHEAVIYELHVGLCGGFSGVADQLERLRDVGVTVVELMPIADFPGKRNWGYDGVLPYAPDESYGSPEELKLLIDRAHGLGMMVMLDVVYNHFGPDGAYLHVFAKQFFDDDKHTPWGAAIDFRRSEVRDYFTQNALYWLNEYRFDGLRFDAVHAIEEPSFLPALATAIRAGVEPGRHVHLVLENEHNDARIIGGGASKFDAQWADDAHHCFHVLLSRETEGYYADYDKPIEMLAKALTEGFVYQGQLSPRGKRRGTPTEGAPLTSFVFCLQNHDQIGNRAMGERLSALAHPRALQAAFAVLLLAPEIPLLFMGEETGSESPFLFFTDFHDELAVLVRDGRRKEFAHFAAFADEKKRAEIPDPNAPPTYHSSRPAAGDPSVAQTIRTLLTARREHVMARIPGAASVGSKILSDRALSVSWRMGDGAVLTIAANFGEAPAAFVAPDGGKIIFETRHDGVGAVMQDRIAARSAAAYLQEPA